MAQIGETLQIKAGTDRTYRHLARRRNATTGAIEAYTDMTSAATVSARVWRGDDQSALLTLTGSAADAAAGYFAVTFSDTNTSSLAEGVYRYEVLATEGGVTVPVFDGRLRVVGTAGSASAPTVLYCTHEDMKLYAPWIDDQSDADEDQAGFVEQRLQATRWLQGLAHAHYRGSAGDVAGYSFTLQNTWSRGRRAGRDSQLQEWLDDGRLILNPDVVEATAKMALHYILNAKLTPGTVASGNGYGALAARFGAEAKSLASTMTLEIDTTTTADGQPDTFIDLSVTDTLYA